LLIGYDEQHIMGEAKGGRRKRAPSAPRFSHTTT
jgi:hypothetical protein